MSAMAPEETTLDDSWLDDHVPCDTKLPTRLPDGTVVFDHQCEKPAVVRVLVVCTKGWDRWRFHCQTCYDRLHAGKMGCLCCQTALAEVKSLWV